MNLTDLEKEPPTIDPTPRPHMGRRPVEDDYPTRPNASQVVAANRRQQLSADPRQLLLGLAALAFVVAMVVAGIWQMTRSAPAPLALPTPAPATTAPAPFSAPPVVDPTQEPTTPQINAYAAPGVFLGPIEVDRRMTPVAHHGSDWIQAEVEGSGLVWLRAADVPALGLVGPDLAAPAPQIGRGLGQVDQGGGDNGEWQPTATTEPATAPAEPTPAWATSAPATAGDFEKPSLIGTCQYVGCLGEKAVDLAREQVCHALYWQYGDVDAEDPSVPKTDMDAIRGCIWEGLYR